MIEKEDVEDYTANLPCEYGSIGVGSRVMNDDLVELDDI